MSKSEESCACDLRAALRFALGGMSAVPSNTDVGTGIDTVAAVERSSSPSWWLVMKGFDQGIAPRAKGAESA